MMFWVKRLGLMRVEIRCMEFGINATTSCKSYWEEVLLLTVIERSSESVGSKNSSWLCKCDCGRFVVLSKRTLERMSFNCYCGIRECLNKYNSNLILIGDKVGTLKILSKIKTKSDFIYETFCVKCNDSAHYQQNHFRNLKRAR